MAILGLLGALLGPFLAPFWGTFEALYSHFGGFLALFGVLDFFGGVGGDADPFQTIAEYSHFWGSNPSDLGLFGVFQCFGGIRDSLGSWK